MSNARNGATPAFRPTRSTRSTTTATAATASSSARTTGAAPTTTTRSRSTSRPPSTTSNGRPGSSTGPNLPSRPGSVAGFSAGTTRSSSAANAGRTSAPVGPSAATTAGVKRRTRTASSDADLEPAAAKRPALSSAFSAHVTQSSLNRQLLSAQAQVTELQNKLLDKQRDIDRLEADLRVVGAREEEEREARKQSDEELAQKTREYETEVTRLRKRLAELEADHEDLDDAYSNLSHSSQSRINALTLEVQTRDERIILLETQLSEAEARARDEEIRAKALEELLEQITEEGSESEGEGEEAEVEEKEEEEDKDVRDKSEELKTDARLALEFKEPESSVDDKSSMNDEAEGEDEDPDADGDADVDADGEADPEESPSMIVDTDRDATPTRDCEFSSGPSAEPNTFYEGSQPEIEAYPDPGAPPPYTATSPASESASTMSHSRSRSASIASSRNTSMGSSQPMSFTGPAPPIGAHRSPSVASISVVSSSRLDPLSHIRRRLSLATPSRRRRSSVAPSREREKDNEIIRTELARQTSHVATLEAANARLTNELTRLRMRAEGAEVLREEKRELEKRVESMEALRVRVAELETSAQEFARREREWEAKLRERAQQVGDENNTPAKTPVGVTQQLTTLRKAHATLLDEHGQLKASLRAREIELTSAREDAENATREADHLREEVDHLQEAVARKEKERVLLEHDATFLRSLVTSYKNEEASFTVSDDGEHPVATEKLEQRIVQLETLLTEYKSTIESLEAEVDRLQRAGSTAANKSQQQWDQLSNKASILEEALNGAQAETRRQTQCVEELEQRLFALGGEIGGGRHIPPATRVLSLRQNPAQEWADTRKEVLDRLKAENEALLARLKELEDQGLRGSTSVSSDPTDDKDKSLFVPRESWASLKQETEEQKSLLAQKEKRLLRLQQVYTAKSAEFREAIESILGLKLAFYPNGQVRVTSVYDLSAAFVFQPSKDKEKGPGKEGEEGVKMQLVAAGERVPEELEGLMNTWIRDEMCIPCFMSSVTLECYDRWKNEQRGAGLVS